MISLASKIFDMFSLNVISDNELNSVALRVPVEGLKNNFVEDTPIPLTFPEVASVNVTYLVAFVDVSSVIVTSAEDPVKPIDPVYPVVPLLPVNPTSPLEPVKPIDPVHQVVPLDPVKPVGP